MSYQDHIIEMGQLIKSKNGTWDGIDPEGVARMRLQNRFKTGLEIARYTAGIMRADMAAYDADSSQYTQSLGCWHGFIAQQKLISSDGMSTSANIGSFSTACIRAVWSAPPSPARSAMSVL